MPLTWRKDLDNLKNRLFKPTHEYIEEALNDFTEKGGEVERLQISDLNRRYFSEQRSNSTFKSSSDKAPS